MLLGFKNFIKQIFIGFVVFFGAVNLAFALNHPVHSQRAHKHAHASHAQIHSLHHRHLSHHKNHSAIHASYHHSKLKNNESVENYKLQGNQIDDNLETKLSTPETNTNINLPVPSVFQRSASQETTEGHAENVSFENDSSLGQESDSNSTLAQTTKQRLVSLVNRAIGALHHTSYRLGGQYFDLSRGIYEEDCSGYVDQLLNRAEPDAYATLTEWTHTTKPSSFDYYDFFRKLPDQSWHFWQKVRDVARLKPGAIMVFRYHGHSRYGSGGHVMVVMSQPIPVENHDDTFLVRVSDSAQSGHSDDTRARHTSGVGIGTLLLKVNPFTHEPNAYAWKLSGWLEHVDVAMAQPVTPA
jgi:hypothetical protein